MREPAFWWEAEPSLAARALSPIGHIWGMVATRRLTRPGVKCPVPLICVGNFVAGGAGKTPVALALMELLLRRGETPAFLTRGYGGRSWRQPLRVELGHHSAADVGDEPLLLARLAPTFVCKDRRLGAEAAIAAGATALVMDDGLQNPSLAKDLSIAVVDAEVGLGNRLCVPAGPMRASFGEQIVRVDAIVLLGKDGLGSDVAVEARARGKSIMRARLNPDPAVAERLRGQRVLAFAGIGRPKKFFETLAQLGANIIATREFHDHHSFSRIDIDGLRKAARSADATLVTTEKDWVRLPDHRGVEALPVRLEFENQDATLEIVDKALIRHRMTGGDGERS